MDKKSKGIIFLLLLVLGVGLATYAIENTDIKEGVTEGTTSSTATNKEATAQKPNKTTAGTNNTKGESSTKANGNIEMKAPQEGEGTTANKGTAQVGSGAGDETNTAKDNAAAQEAGAGETLGSDPNKAKAQVQNQKETPKKDGKEKAKENHNGEAKGQKNPKKKPLRKEAKIVRMGWSSYLMGLLGQEFMAYLLLVIIYVIYGFIVGGDRSHQNDFQLDTLKMRFCFLGPGRYDEKALQARKSTIKRSLTCVCIAMLVIDFGMYLFNQNGMSLSALLAKIPFIGYYFGGFWYDMMYTEEIVKGDLK